MPDRAYLDWNATAPLRPEARAAMIEAMDVVGNPSSVHTEGRAAKMIIEKAREQVAALVGCASDEVVFTSGATEAAAKFFADTPSVCTAVEHDCVFGLADESGIISVNNSGEILTSGGSACVPSGFHSTATYGCQTANSETGVLQDIANFTEGLDVFTFYRVFSDMVQSVGKQNLKFSQLSLAAGAVSAHKFGGPKAVGALVLSGDPFLKDWAALYDTDQKSGQEKGRRSGTENVIGIAGFGAAAKAAQRDLDAGAWEPVEELRDDLEAVLRDCAGDDLTIFGESAPRLPNTSCFAIPGWKGETQVMQLDLAGFAVSAGSACSSGKVGPSRVLKAMGFDDITASSAIRVSMGPTTTKDEVTRFIDAWTGLYQRMKARAA